MEGLKALQKSEIHYLSDEIKEKGFEMANIYTYLYMVENAIRNFMDTVFRETYGEGYFEKLVVPRDISETISIRKSEERKQAWFPIRGENNLYYLDFKQTTDLISNNWDLFKSYFPDQAWIRTKINELSHVRNLVAHNSYVSPDEQAIVDVNFRSILRQLRAINVSAFKEKKPWIETSEQNFVTGLRLSKSYSFAEVEGGNEFVLDYPDLAVAPISLRFYFEQNNVCYYIVFENAKVELTHRLDFSLAYELGEESIDYKKHCRFQFGQYDIDQDGVDELFFAVQDAEEGAIQISVVKYFPPALQQHAHRSENFELIGSILQENIFGGPKAHIKGMSITIPRNHRGFYYEYTWMKNKFHQTGEY